MITTDFVRTMANYNTWQNSSVYTAASTLTDEARRLDRQAFFGSIHQTLNHILWGDQMWLSRFTDTLPPSSGSIGDSVYQYESWEALGAERHSFDERITRWSNEVSEHWLSQDLSWYSGSVDRELTRPAALLVVHLFNHQTHHRGQVHAMLTAAGARPDDTDLPFQTL